jgi:hypothetical protein
VVVVNCIQPVNWQYCYRIDQWLIPDLVQGIEMYLDKDQKYLYRDEREYLKTYEHH